MIYIVIGVVVHVILGILAYLHFRWTTLNEFNKFTVADRRVAIVLASLGLVGLLGSIYDTFLDSIT